MDPLQWMGAIRMRVETAPKNVTIIHTTPVHQLMSCEAKRCKFVINKTFLICKQCLTHAYYFQQIFIFA